MKIHKGDTVEITVGKDSGKTGKVLKIDSKKNKIVVEGLNLAKKHRRPKRQGEKGEIVTVARPLDASKVMLICSNCKKITRVGYEFIGGKKTRYCKKCKTAV